MRRAIDTAPSTPDLSTNLPRDEAPISFSTGCLSGVSPPERDGDSEEWWRTHVKPFLVPLFTSSTLLDGGFERDLVQKFKEGWRMNELCLHGHSGEIASLQFSLFYPTNPEATSTAPLEVIAKFPKSRLFIPGNTSPLPSKGYETYLDMYPTPNLLGTWTAYAERGSDKIIFSDIIGVRKDGYQGEGRLTDLTYSWDWLTGYYSIRARAGGLLSSHSSWSAGVQFLRQSKETDVLRVCYASNVIPEMNKCTIEYQPKR